MSLSVKLQTNISSSTIQYNKIKTTKNKFNNLYKIFDIIKEELLFLLYFEHFENISCFLKALM